MLILTWTYRELEMTLIWQMMKYKEKKNLYKAKRLVAQLVDSIFPIVLMKISHIQSPLTCFNIEFIYIYIVLF